MSIAGDGKIATSIVSSVTHSNLSTSVEQFKDTKLETIHGHVISFHEKYIFPLLGETNRSVPPLTIIKIFEYFFLAIQIYLLGQFSFLNDSYLIKSFKAIYKIFFIGFSGDISNLYIPIIAIIILHLFTGILILSAAAIFNSSHEISKIALYFVRIWNGSLYHILIIPNSLFFFATFTLLGEDKRALIVFLCIVSGIFLIFSLYHYFFISLILNRSPYLSNTLIQLWRPNLFYNMIFIYSISAGINIYSKNFKKYYRLIPSIMYILSSPVFSYQFFYDNFSNIFFNALFFSVSASGSLSSLFTIINIFLTNPINKYIFYLVPFCLLILLIIVSIILIHFRRKKVKKQLQYTTNDMSSESKNSYFDDIGIKTKNQAFMYLQSGLENASDLFVDFSLHNYIKEKFENDNEIFVVLMWFVAFFPGNNILLQVYLKQFSTIISPSNYDKSLFLQIHRVHVFRQSSAYKESDSDYKKLRHYTDKLTAQYANLWHHIGKTCDKKNEEEKADDVIDDILANINSSRNRVNNTTNFINKSKSSDDDNNEIPVLNNYSKTDNLFEKATALRLSADLAWVESIGKYPNNSRFANEYSRYLLKARCRYKKGLKWKARAELLEQGKKLEQDQMFFHFIMTYPHYIKKQIVDYEGAFIPIESRKSTSRSSSDSISSIPVVSSSTSITSTNSSQTSSSYSDTSSQMSDNEDMNEKEQLLLSMERAVSVISSSNITRILISAVFRLILTLVYSVVCFVLVLSLFYDKDRFFATFKFYAKTTNFIELASQQIIWLYANSFDKSIMSYSSLSDSIGPSFYKNVNNFEINLTKYLFNLSSAAIESYSSMAYETYRKDFSSSKELVNLTQILSRNKIDNNFCYIDKKVIGIQVILTLLAKTTENSITPDFLIRNMLMDMINMSFQKADYRKTWSSSTEFCTFVYRHWDFYHIITEITKEINPLFKSVVDDYELNNFSSKYLFSDENKTIKDYAESLDKFNSSNEYLNPDDSSSYLDFISNAIVSLSPFVCMAFILPLIIFLSVGVNQEWQSYIGILRQFSPIQIERAMSKSSKSKADKYNDKTLLIQDMTKREIPTWIPNVISALIVISALLLLGLLSRSQIQDINHAIMQFSLINQIQSTLFSMATDLIFMLQMKEIEGQDELEKYLSISNFTFHIDHQLDLFTIAYNIVQYGGPNLPGLIGKRKELSEILYTEKCTPNLRTKYPIEYYSCISFENLIHYYTKTIKTVYNAFDQYSLKSDLVMNIAFITRTRLLEDGMEIINRCEDIYANKRKTFIILAVVFLLIASFMCVIAFIFDIRIIGKVKNTIETFKDLSLRIDPIDFVTNDKMISLIYGKSRAVKQKITSATHALFFTSKHGMMCVNKNFVIEDINPAASSIFGFTAEQMVGQHISVFIPEKLEENERFYLAMQMMSEGRRSMTYKDEVVAMTDNGTQAPLITTLIGSCPDSKDFEKESDNESSDDENKNDRNLFNLENENKGYRKTNESKTEDTKKSEIDNNNNNNYDSIIKSTESTTKSENDNFIFKSENTNKKDDNGNNSTNSNKNESAAENKNENDSSNANKNESAAKSNDNIGSESTDNKESANKNGGTDNNNNNNSSNVAINNKSSLTILNINNSNKSAENGHKSNEASSNKNVVHSSYNRAFASYTEKNVNEGYNSFGSRRFAESFNIMFEDKSDEINSKAALEQAQKQSQSFLNKMFPQTILTRIMHSNDPITFDVNLASVAIIDIEKFSTFVDTFSPSLMLQNIKAIVKSFDTILNKYFLLTKVKVFGDCYMAASGLFSADISNTAKANQMLLFCFDCIESIDETNMNLNSSFQARIGITTGGPIAVGVFGTEKPSFDIIGEPIQTAFLIQKKSKPNAIRISQETYELVATSNFNFDNAEKIQLNDNREINTFYVTRRSSAANGNYSRTSSCFFSSLMAGISSDTGISASMSSQVVNTDFVEDELNEHHKQIRPSFSDIVISEHHPEQMINLMVSESEEVTALKKKSSQSILSCNDESDDKS